MDLESIKKIHFVGIGGVGMGTLAMALSRSGYDISGSDENLYEPMRGLLLASSIRIIDGYSSLNTDKCSPDLVIIGNVVRKENEEGSAWIRKGVRFISFAEAVRRFIIGDKKSIVCAGTHGKTTTTTWLSYLLSQLSLNPSFLIGGVPKDLPSGCSVGDGDYFVGEGDEYDTAFFDKGPKFLHYRPDFLILTSIEYDHADIYDSFEAVKHSFEKLIALLPGDGLCVARYEDPVVLEKISKCLCPVQTFGMQKGAMWRIGRVEESEKGYKFEIIYRNHSLGYFETSLLGEHNLLNLLSGIICAINLGQSVENIRSIVPTFGGVRRRQEILSVEPVLLIDDFAHHPTEVRATLKGVRKRYTKQKIWALFEPRSHTARRNIHQKEYESAFDDADEVLLGRPYRENESGENRFSITELIEALKQKGKNARGFSSSDEIVMNLGCEPGDVIVVMSNGEFGKIQEKILKKYSS